MQIEHLIKREGGSVHEIGGTEYHFAPLDDGAHVAEVTNPDHQDRFLSISEGFRIYRPGRKDTAAPAPAHETHKPVSTALLGSDVHPSTFDIGGQAIALGDVVRAAFARSGVDVDSWNAFTAEQRHGLIDAELDALAAAAEADDAPLDGSEPVPAQAAAPAALEDERAALAAAYEAKFGKKPHHKLSLDKLRAEVQG